MKARAHTRLYDSHADAVQVIRGLEAAGVPHSDISIVGHGDRTAGGTPPRTVPDAADDGTAAGATEGTVIGGGIGLLAGLGMLAIPGIGPIVAAGWLVAAVTGAGAGAAVGSLLGSLMGAGVPEDDANAYAEGIRRGGTLVTVRPVAGMDDQISKIMDGRSTVDVAARRAELRSEGWDRFDPAGPAHAPQQVKMVEAVKTTAVG